MLALEYNDMAALDGRSESRHVEDEHDLAEEMKSNPNRFYGWRDFERQLDARDRAIAKLTNTSFETRAQARKRIAREKSSRGHSERMQTAPYCSIWRSARAKTTLPKSPASKGRLLQFSCL